MVIAIFLVVTGWFFFSTFFIQDQASLRAFFNLLPITFSLVVPALTMRLVVASLTGPLTIKAFFSQELPPPYNTHKQYFRDILQEYAQNANQNFNYELIEVPAQARDKQRRAEEYGIQPMQVQIVEEDALSYKKVYMGAALIHGDAVEKLPSITSPRDLEYRLTSSMRKLQNKVSALLALDTPVQIKLIVSSSLSSIAPAIGLEGLSNLPEKIRNVVGTLNAENYGKLNFSHLDPKQPDLRELVSTYDLQELQWPDIPDTDISAGSGAIGLVVEHGDAHRTLSLLNVTRLPLLGTQYSLLDTSRIRELISLNMKNLLGINQALGYLAGHGTPPISPMSLSNRQDGLTITNARNVSSICLNKLTGWAYERKKRIHYSYPAHHRSGRVHLEGPHRPGPLPAARYSTFEVFGDFQDRAGKGKCYIKP